MQKNIVLFFIAGFFSITVSCSKDVLSPICALSGNQKKSESNKKDNISENKLKYLFGSESLKSELLDYNNEEKTYSSENGYFAINGNFRTFFYSWKNTFKRDYAYSYRIEISNGFSYHCYTRAELEQCKIGNPEDPSGYFPFTHDGIGRCLELYNLFGGSVFVVSDGKGEKFWRGKDLTPEEQREDHAYYIEEYSDGGRKLRQSQPIVSKRINALPILGADDRRIYVTDAESHVYAIDRSAGTVDWKSPFKPRFLSVNDDAYDAFDYNRRFGFLGLEDVFMLFYRAQANDRTDYHLKIYNKSDGSIVYDIASEYEIKTAPGNSGEPATGGDIFIAAGTEIMRASLKIPAGERARPKMINKLTMREICPRSRPSCKHKIESIQYRAGKLYAVYAGWTDDDFSESLWAFDAESGKVLWHFVFASSYPDAPELRRWASNYLIARNEMFFLDLADESITAIDLETGKISWRYDVPPFRADETYEALTGFAYSAQGEPDKSDDIFGYAGNVQFYTIDDKLALVYRGIRVFEFADKNAEGEQIIRGDKRF